jgi:thiol-disulfide isomerase/thioredoxin
VRVAPCFAVIVCLLLGLSGCQLFKKKDSGGDTPFLGTPPSDTTAKTKPTDPLSGPGVSDKELDGLLAGQVIDGLGRPADAQIRWVCLDSGKDDESGYPVAVNGQGYFVIKGVKAGKQYKLVTRAKNGEKTLETVTITKAPNVNLLIQLNDRFAVPDRSKPGTDKSKQTTDTSAERLPAVPLPSSAGANFQQGAGLPAAPQPPVGPKTQIVQAEAATLPALEIGPTKAGPGASAVVPPAPPPSLGAPVGPAPVPSSIRIGTRIENFALYDTSLRPWEWKANRTGKLTLIECWKTTCPPCLQSIAILRILQDKFGPQGLEVVGIAYEDSGTAVDNAQRVAAVGQGRQANYKLLLGGGASCPLKRDLQIRMYPTLILLDESGTILWRHESALDREKLDELEFFIRRRLAP